MHVLQGLIHYCKRFFSQPQSERSSQHIHHLLNRINPQIFNIHAPKDDIECYLLYHTQDFTMCLFVMRPGAFMPIHDHPKMSVFTKVLKGRVELSTYDLHNDNRATRRREILELQSKAVELLPDGPGLHSFRALDEVWFLDILGPPYEENCTYYREIDYTIPDKEENTVTHFGKTWVKLVPDPSIQCEPVQRNFK